MRESSHTGSTAPAGYLTFRYRTNGVLVSEASVPISSPITSGRIYSVVDGGSFALNGPTTTGVAIVNPNSTAATVTFYFTDANGQNFGNSSFVLPANQQIAKFVNEFPFNAGAKMNGTMTFSSTVPVAVIALLGVTNERGEFLMTTLPVTDLTAAPSTDVLFFPHFAQGFSQGVGWDTLVVLVNPTDSVISGSLSFIGGNDYPKYAIPPRSSAVYSVRIPDGPNLYTGEVVVTPDSGNVSPSGLLIFSFKNNSVTVTTAGIPLMRPSGAFRMYVVDAGSYQGQLQTGLAIANPTSGNEDVTLELTNLAGQPTGMTSAVTITGNGHIAMFMRQFPGFESIPYPFRGAVRISTTASQGIAVIGLRGEYNERSDFLITTSMPASEATPPSLAEAFFPHLADGGGYTTEFALFSGSPGQTASGLLRFFTQSGAPWN
jgi:hypothetical protein